MGLSELEAQFRREQEVAVADDIAEAIEGGVDGTREITTIKVQSAIDEWVTEQNRNRAAAKEAAETDNREAPDLDELVVPTRTQVIMALSTLEVKVQIEAKADIITVEEPVKKANESEKPDIYTQEAADILKIINDNGEPGITIDALLEKSYRQIVFVMTTGLNGKNARSASTMWDSMVAQNPALADKKAQGFKSKFITKFRDLKVF
jgi:hypothetical protein